MRGTGTTVIISVMVSCHASFGWDCFSLAGIELVGRVYLLKVWMLKIIVLIISGCEDLLEFNRIDLEPFIADAPCYCISLLD